MSSFTAPELKFVILAAGFSSRLGTPKALAQVRSVTLLRRTLTLAARFAPAHIIVVVPRGAARFRIEARGLNVTFAVNSRRSEGLSSSVRLGIERARYSTAVLLLPVDLVALKLRDVRRLISRWRAARRRVIARSVETKGAAHGGVPHGGVPHGGVPLILPRWLYPRALAVRGDTGLRGLVAGLSPKEQVLLNLPSAAFDVDTPQDLSTARRRRTAG
ncbi:MAG: nucleotidyltransferase family protein [Gammaproteobacteria bacterium]